MVTRKANIFINHAISIIPSQLLKKQAVHGVEAICHLVTRFGKCDTNIMRVLERKFLISFYANISFSEVINV